VCACSRHAFLYSRSSMRTHIHSKWQHEDTQTGSVCVCVWPHSRKKKIDSTSHPPAPTPVRYEHLFKHTHTADHTTSIRRTHAAACASSAAARKRCCSGCTERRRTRGWLWSVGGVEEEACNRLHTSTARRTHEHRLTRALVIATHSSSSSSSASTVAAATESGKRTKITAG
jgi:hypothetical protein